MITRLYIKLFIGFVLFLSVGSISAQEQSGQKFIRITHSSNKTVAVDSTGQTWYYDADEEKFVKYKKYSRRESEFTDEPIDDEILLPPEIRCTEIYKGDLVELFDDVIVDIDERIEGTVFGFNDVIVKGLVTQDVVSLKRVVIESSGEVRGDVIAAEIVRRRGGKIRGAREEIPLFRRLSPRVIRISNFLPGYVNFIITGFLLFICLVFLALLPNNLRRIVKKIKSSVISSFFWGLLVWISFIPLILILTLTVIGIPLLPLVVILFPLMILLGYIAGAIYIGGIICRIVRITSESMYLFGALGVIFIELGRYGALIFQVSNLDVLAILAYVAHGIIGFIVVSIGMGAVVSARFGMKPKERDISAQPEVTPPPPIDECYLPPVPPPPPSSSSSHPDPDSRDAT
ncbi:MAG: polymer-forming cytoskeletal protein [candidate division Zixibacteria bacterium]